ncbi:hypothetical protein UCRPC4_g04472 [Phaeomoniella chlamydospora]|uniref:Uncharacterized protein n=1 Tax=Phaeomoniella chlamydospora TaxID=158046 RepID=A0A0G2EAE1_PHACM|nr:hypothetical protein UCRPC4_g04472 [Phaeomoniella chlamydospora]
MASINQTYGLAHTAECKLKLAAGRPDRNLRFILGHAFTLDAINLRIVQISEEQDAVDQEYPQSQVQGETETRIRFSGRSKKPPGESRRRAQDRKRSPPPATLPPESIGDEYDDDGADSNEEDELAEDLDSEEDLGLIRFQSASATQPRTLSDVEDESSSEEEEDELPSPPLVYSDAQIRDAISAGQDQALAEIYQSIKGCGCQKHLVEQGPEITSLWSLPESERAGKNGVPKVAIVAT